jgi:hypothetical protein
VPQRKQAPNLRQPPPADGCCCVAAVHQCLKVSFQVYHPNAIAHLRVTLSVPLVSTARPFVRRPHPAATS